MTFSVPPQILADATDKLLTPHHSSRYAALIKYTTARGYPVVSITDIEREQRRRGIVVERPVSKQKRKRR